MREQLKAKIEGIVYRELFNSGISAQHRSAIVKNTTNKLLDQLEQTQSTGLSDERIEDEAEKQVEAVANEGHCMDEGSFVVGAMWARDQITPSIEPTNESINRFVSLMDIGMVGKSWDRREKIKYVTEQYPKHFKSPSVVHQEQEFMEFLNWCLFDYGMGIEYIKSRTTSNNHDRVEFFSSLFERYCKENKIFKSPDTWVSVEERFPTADELISGMLIGFDEDENFIGEVFIKDGKLYEIVYGHEMKGKKWKIVKTPTTT